MQDQSLAKLDAVLAALEAATTVQEIKNTIDMAVIMDVYAKQAKLGKDIELKASEYVIRAERKLGEMLKAAKAAGQITHAHDPRHKPKSVVPNENNRSFTLEEAGISRKLSSKAQKIAAIPKADFEKRVAAGKESGKLTSNTVMKSANGQEPDAATNRRAHALYKDAREDEIVAMSKSGLTLTQIAAETGSSSHTIRRILERGKIRHSQEPLISQDALALTAQQKLELAIKQHKEKLTAEFHVAVNLRVQEFLENTIGPILRKEQAEARRITNSRKGVMTRKDYIKIRACLHPDSILDPEQKPKYEAAFKLFEGVEKLLLNEKESPTEFLHVPVTPADWDALKKQATERKKAARRASKGGTNITGRQ